MRGALGSTCRLKVKLREEGEAILIRHVRAWGVAGKEARFRMDAGQ